MFDDLEDLLEDVPQPNSKKQTITSSGKAPSSSSQHAAAKKPSAFNAAEEEFDWDRPTKKKPDALAGGGGSAADWGNADWDDENIQKKKANDDLFGEAAEWGGKNYSAFGVLGKSRSGMFGKQRNSTGGNPDPGGDLLDTILDDMEEKKGIETSKKSGAPSVGSQSASQQPRGIKPGQTDAWGRETFNEFEDFGEEDQKKTPQAQNLLDKKRALFGLPQDRRNQPVSKSLGREPGDDLDNVMDDGPTHYVAGGGRPARRSKPPARPLTGAQEAARPHTGKPPKHQARAEFEDDADVMGLLDQPTSKKDSQASGGMNKLNSIEHDEDEEDYGHGIEYHSDQGQSEEEEEGGTPDDYREQNVQSEEEEGSEESVDMGHYISSLNRAGRTAPGKASAQNSASKQAKPAAQGKNLGAMRNGPKSMGAGSANEKGKESKRGQTISSDAAQDNSSKDNPRGAPEAKNGGTKKPGS